MLGALAVHHEELSPSEIKVRTDWDFKNFYWSPAVSHIRRELRRLLELGFVEELAVPVGNDRSPMTETVVVKNSVLLKVYLSGNGASPVALAVIDSRLAEVAEAIHTAQWGHRRMIELGIGEDPALRNPQAVSDYVLRALYFEQGNLRQLRDTIEGFDVKAFSHDETIERLPIRPRRSLVGEEPS